MVNSNNKYDVGKLLKTLNINRQESILDKLISPKYYEVMISKGYHNELLKLIKENLEKYPETSNYLNINMMKFINDKDFFISLFYLYIDKNVLIPSGLAKTIDEKDWINVFNKYSNDEDKIINIIRYYCSAYENISIFINKLSYDLFFKWILSYGSSIIYYDTLIEYVQNNFDNIKNINDNNLFVSIINQMIKVDDDNFKEKFISVITRDMIERFNSNSEISLGKLCENQKINSDSLKFIKSEEEIFHKKQKEQEKRKEEEQKLIEDQKLIEEAKKYLKDNDINKAWNTFVKINDKSKCKDLYMFFLNNIDAPFNILFNGLYVKQDDELTNLFFNKYLDKYQLPVTKWSGYFIKNSTCAKSDDVIKQLLSDQKKDLILLLTGFDDKNKETRCKNKDYLFYLYDNGIRSPLIDELINNYNLLKEKNPALSRDNSSLYMELLYDDVVLKYGPQFIVDLLTYNTIAIINFYKNRYSKSMINLEKYLRDNGIYTVKNLHEIIMNWKNLEPLITNLIDNEIVLTDEDKNIFIDYFEKMNTRSKMMYDNGILLNISTIEELRSYDEILNKKMLEMFDLCKNPKALRECIEFGLFNNNIPINFNNNFLINRLNENEYIDKFDLALIEILKDIDNIKSSDFETAKKKYSEILKRGINLSKKSKLLSVKKDNYYLNLINGKIEKSLKLGLKDDTILKKIGEKQIPIIEYREQPFTFLIHGIWGGAEDSDSRKIGENILENPSMWNESEASSTISCSLISDKYIGTINSNKQVRGVILGFSKIPNNSLLAMSNKDGMTSHDQRMFKPVMQHSNALNSPDYLIKSTTEAYNEVALYRVNELLKEHNGRIQPSFVICMYDEPDENELRWAAYFDIPIIKINKELYKKQNEEKANNYKTGNITKFDIEDVKEILSLKEFSESESEALIFSYLDKLELPDEEYNKFIDEVREVIIDFYIHDANKIDQVLSELEQHRRVTFSQEDGYGRH